jgi:hypothetical protein
MGTMGTFIPSQAARLKTKFSYYRHVIVYKRVTLTQLHVQQLSGAKALVTHVASS